MLAALIIASTVMPPRPVSPQCEYSRYMSAAIWSALDDAEHNGASKFAIHNLETSLHASVEAERGACK